MTTITIPTWLFNVWVMMYGIFLLLFLTIVMPLVALAFTPIFALHYTNLGAPR